MKRKFSVEYEETHDPQGPQRSRPSRKALWIALISLVAAIIGLATALIKTGVIKLP